MRLWMAGVALCAGCSGSVSSVLTEASDAGVDAGGDAHKVGLTHGDSGLATETGTLDTHMVTVEANEVDACVVLTCAELGAICGDFDRCGVHLACGQCTVDAGCQPPTCASLGSECGVVLDMLCGGTPISCGFCTDGLVCHYGTTANTCAPTDAG